jgi:hypothetical protein
MSNQQIQPSNISEKTAFLMCFYSSNGRESLSRSWVYWASRLLSTCLFVALKKYEAIARVTMAKLPKANNILGANIEGSSALIARMSLPNSFYGIVKMPAMIKVLLLEMLQQPGELN